MKRLQGREPKGAIEMQNNTTVHTEILRGEGIEIVLAYGANNSIHYSLRGAGMTPDAGIWIGDRAGLLAMLLSPAGCVERDGRVVAGYAR